MNIHTAQVGFFIILILGISVLIFFIISPFVTAIFFAVIIGLIARPINEWMLKVTNGRGTISAFLATLVVLLVILVPLSVIANLLIKESADLYSETVRGGSGYSIVNVLNGIEEGLNKIIPGDGVNFGQYTNLEPLAEKVIVWFSQNLSSFFGSIFKLTLGAFIFVLCLFYIFRDGKKLRLAVVSWSPLLDAYDSLILKKLETAVNSVVRGQLAIGIIQGFLTGLGFAIFGIPHPVIWGFVAVVASLIPTLGTGIVILPAVLYLFATGNNGTSLGLLIWGAVAVGLIDNILGPILIKRGVHIHPFLILISVLGGIALFGPIGFIAGPVVLSLFFALFEIYPFIIKQQPITKAE